MMQEVHTLLEQAVADCTWQDLIRIFKFGLISQIIFTSKLRMEEDNIWQDHIKDFMHIKTQKENGLLLTSMVKESILKTKTT